MIVFGSPDRLVFVIQTNTKKKLIMDSIPINMFGTGQSYVNIRKPLIFNGIFTKWKFYRRQANNAERGCLIYHQKFDGRCCYCYYFLLALDICLLNYDGNQNINFDSQYHVAKERSIDILTTVGQYDLCI